MMSRMERDATATQIAPRESPEQLFRAFLVCLLAGMVAAFSPALRAAPESGFTGGVTPSRFEISASPGDTVRRSLEIYNLGRRPTLFRIATSDWSYSERGQISYSNPLLPGSCRPWVRLESHEVQIVPNPRQPRAYRFEVHIPNDAKPQECRFALMIESVDRDYTTQFEDAGITMPVTGRLAVIVYLAIGDVEPELVLEGMEVREVHGRRVPVVKVSNEGAAHGRLDGDLYGTEEDGTRRPLSVATSPIMPGQTRYMTISPVENTEPLKFPLKIEGRIYATGDTFAIDSLLTDP